MLPTIEWTGSHVRLLDQTKLPTETVYLDIADETQMWDAIKRLCVRGAPAIGVSAAFGVYLGINRFEGDADGLLVRLNAVADYLATSRPTAVNLFWALDRIRRVAAEARQKELSTVALKDRVLNECIAMHREDAYVCQRIGKHGLKLLQSLVTEDRPIELITHCNAGALATVAYGTALAPIYVGVEQGVKFNVFADETRPLLQGSRITAYELSQAGVPVTVLCDNMAASLMSSRKIDAVIVGTDRVAANGDVANKIGTHGLAILARHFNVPFYVACPVSTIDRTLANGSLIPIEHRAAEEVSHGFGKQTAPSNAQIYNPAFDVTPNLLVTAIITEQGVIAPPYDAALSKLHFK